MNRHHRRRFLAGPVLALMAACQGGPGTQAPPTLEQVILNPGAATLVEGTTQQFSVVARRSDGSTVPVAVTYSATGGTITGSGLYTARNVGGGYRVVATLTGGTLADTAGITVTPVGVHAYTTTFLLSESPISESGRWINGGTLGLDWTNVSTTPGLAIGHQVGASYTDATALLTGTWGPDQMATATVHTVNQKDACYQELELRLRSAMTPHVNSGYEVSYKCSQTPSAYLIIVRWNGALGDFTYLFNQTGTQYALKDGDVIGANIVGNLITAFKNGLPVAQVKDDTYTSGSPGMGFNLENASAGCAGTNGDYGYTSYTATDFALAPAAVRRTRPVRTASPRNRRRRAGVGTATAGSARHAQRGRNKRTSLPQRRAANST